MFGFRFFCAVVLVSMIAIPSKANSRAAFRDAEDTRADAQSNQEFRAQVAAIVQSYRKGDTTGGRQLIEQFRLPNAKDWFSEHLNPADSAEFASRYDRLYASFAESFELTVKDIVATRGAELGTEVDLGEGETPTRVLRPGAKLSGIVSAKPVAFFSANSKSSSRRHRGSPGAIHMSIRMAHFAFWALAVGLFGYGRMAPKEVRRRRVVSARQLS